MTSKGQLTLPVAVRKQLGIQVGDYVLIKTTDEAVTIEKMPWTLESAFGSVPALPGVETGDFDDLIEEAMSDHADEVVARMREESA